MNIGPFQFERKQQARSFRLKQAVLASFHEPSPSVRARLGEFGARDWERAKYWLDVSGLALYFLDRLIALDLQACIPATFLKQLQDDLANNRERTVSLIAEAVELARGLKQRKIECALLKGTTLPSESVPDFALRNQMDLDFLIRESDANATKEFLGERGYSLDAVSGSTWEFKTGPSGTSSLKNLYQVRPERAVEVHLFANAIAASSSDRLTRAHWQTIHGQQIPALSPADLFVLQGQHLFKHMCGEHTRASWVLEYWRHVCARRNDAAFWHEVELIAAQEPGANIAIGAATLLASLVFGPFAPRELSRWTMDQLQAAICLWIHLYGLRVLLSNTPGSKLYLLLRKELNPGSPTEHLARRRLIFPVHWPQRITRAADVEGTAAKLRRYRVQTQFVIRRLRFHVAEGVGLAIESLRWQRRVAGGSQLNACISKSSLRTLLLATVAGCSVLAGYLPAQTLPTPSTTSASDSDTFNRSVGSEDSTVGTMPSQVSLSASQIISILQERPEVVVELKDLMAQTQQGEIAVQPDSITDEMLYSQVVSNKDLRQNISMFLRARGYVNDDDLQREAATNPSILDRQPSMASQRSTSGGQSDRIIPNAPVDAAALPKLPLEQLSASSTQIVPQRYETKTPSAPEREPRATNNNPTVLHRQAPYNLNSLRDLYTQVSDSPNQLKRFGSEIFVRRDRTVSSLAPLDVPIGPDYVVGPGDNLAINMWGGVSQTLSRVVGPDGHLSLPEAGDIQIAGLTLEKAQGLIQEPLKKQYRNVQVSVTLAKLRAIRVYVVGDVQIPGAYEISSLASPLSALVAAGGPTALGSLRIIKHYRGTQLLGAIDLYDFLLRGVRDTDDRMQAGDTLVVPTAGAQVSLWGAVKRPAIYELKDETNLASLLEDAGGFTAAASLSHIAIERIDANEQRETISVGTSTKDKNSLSTFEIRDGDRIHIAAIAPYSERVIYVEGHVVRPGRHPFRDGMRISDVLQSYQDLLPEPAARAEIVRLVPPDLHVVTIEFNVPDALIGNGNVYLQPFDTIRILGRYELDAPKVEIRGEVLRPGSYPLSEGMTAAQLVRMAGGFKRDALLERADLISYHVVNGTKVEIQRADLRIGEAVDGGDATTDRDLKPGDVLTIHQITGWNDIGASITIEGEVAHPGSYGFQEGERLSDMLRRAGGFRETAYPSGAVMVRDQVRELEEKSRVELIRQIETSAAAARLSPNITTTDQSGQAEMIQQQQEQILSRLKNQPATGRLVIHITANINDWAGTPADIEVRQGDVLRIPKRPGFVLVSGQVYNASAITFTPGKTAGWYLQRAGGATTTANRKEVFVIRANGSVVGRRSGEWYDHDVLSTQLEPGDVVVVPQKIMGASLFWRNLLTTAQLASSIAITAAVAGL